MLASVLRVRWRLDPGIPRESSRVLVTSFSSCYSNGIPKGRKKGQIAEGRMLSGLSNRRCISNGSVKCHPFPSPCHTMAVGTADSPDHRTDPMLYSRRRYPTNGQLTFTTGLRSIDVPWGICENYVADYNRSAILNWAFAVSRGLLTRWSTVFWDLIGYRWKLPNDRFSLYFFI